MTPTSSDHSRTTIRNPPTPSTPLVRVVYKLPCGELQTAQFATAFTVGRATECDVCIADTGVSRAHLRVSPQLGRWWAEDLQSSNGTYIDGQAINRMPLEGTLSLELGHDGPLIRVIAPEIGKSPRSTETSPDIEIRGKTNKSSKRVEQPSQDREPRRPRHILLLFATLVLLLGVIGGGIYAYLQQQQKVEAMTELAVEIFYDIKNIELQTANLEDEFATASADVWQERITERQQQLRNLEQRYDIFIDAIRDTGIFGTAEEDRLILHMARVFGENELQVPEGFVAEVKNYIKKWQSSSRYENAIKRLTSAGYLPFIRKALADHGLPPQFLYLALQETNFQVNAVGPDTAFGHAKGMWQFIPMTAERFGLRVGPLKDEGVYDPEDERHDFEKATLAAANYLKEIYRTEAQASGLLVMASYNWGEGRVNNRLRKLPMNPRERNFWELLRRYKIPDETYDYVYYIFSAAVIGENPKLFGFGFENPLKGIERTRP